MKKREKNQPGKSDPKPGDNPENKIQRHLSEKDSTISEEDIENINTDIKSGDNIPGKKNREEKNQSRKAKNKSEGRNDEKPKKELPTVWDIID